MNEIENIKKAFVDESLLALQNKLTFGKYNIAAEEAKELLLQNKVFEGNKLTYSILMLFTICSLITMVKESDCGNLLQLHNESHIEQDLLNR